MRKYKKWIVAFVLLFLVLMFFKFGAAHINSIANYFITKDDVDQGGGASQSTNFKMVDAIGQPGGVGSASSTNFKESSGFFSGGEIIAPTLSITPTTLDFGSDLTSKTFQISNTGNGTLAWTVSENPDKPWITSITPNGGSNSATITVTVDRSLLAGSSDTGNLSVTSNGGSAIVAVQIQAPQPGIPIYPAASTTQPLGSEFWIDIVVGDSATPVSDLFGVSFDLNFTNTNYLDVVTPHSSNVISSDFIGNDLVFIQTVDETSGKVSIGISRKAGDGGVSGFGTVARIKFVSHANAPNGTNIQFSLSSVSANDTVGTTIPMSPVTLTVTLSGITVWPGDTNSEGIVNQADILPLDLFWASTGPQRPNASIIWSGQSASPWTPENATYADANGDGSVNQADVLPIGLNWGKTHAPISGLANEDTTDGLNKPNTQTLKIHITGSTKQNQTCWVEIVVDEVTNLFGISFELIYSPTTYIDSVEVSDGSWLGDDIIFYPYIDKIAGKVSLGITRKAGQGGKSGTGIIATIQMKFKDIPPVETVLTLENIAANDDLGNAIQFDVVNHTITEVEQEIVEILPTTFALHQNYPNPFNPRTTIVYQLPVSADVELSIFSMVGQRMTTLIQERQSAGNYRMEWNAVNLPSGIYFYRLKAKAVEGNQRGFEQVRKLILLK